MGVRHRSPVAFHLNETSQEALFERPVEVAMPSAIVRTPALAVDLGEQAIHAGRPLVLSLSDRFGAAGHRSHHSIALRRSERHVIQQPEPTAVDSGFVAVPRSKALADFSIAVGSAPEAEVTS